MHFRQRLRGRVDGLSPEQHAIMIIHHFSKQLHALWEGEPCQEAKVSSFNKCYAKHGACYASTHDETTVMYTSIIRVRLQLMMNFERLQFRFSTLPLRSALFDKWVGHLTGSTART